MRNSKEESKMMSSKETMNEELENTLKKWSAYAADFGYLVCNSSNNLIVDDDKVGFIADDYFKFDSNSENLSFVSNNQFDNANIKYLDCIYDDSPLNFENTIKIPGIKKFESQDPKEEINLGDKNIVRPTYISNVKLITASSEP